jgi:hypothetical protein
MSVAITSDEAKHWRKLALEALARAQKTTAPEDKAMMLGIAAGYDRLGDQAEEQARIQRKSTEPPPADVTKP